MKQKMEDAIKRRKAIMVIMEIILVIGCIISIWIMSIPKDKFLASTYSYSKVEKYEINGNYITRVMPQTDYETFIKIAQNTLKDTVSEDFSIKVYKDKEKTQEVTSGYITTGMIVAVNSENEEKKEEIVEQKDESANQVVSANTINANSNSEKQNVISEDEKAKNETNENAINETNAVAQNVVDSEKVDVENKVDTRSSSEDVLEDSETKDEVNKGLEYTINVVGDLTENGDMSVTELTRIVRGVVKLKNWDFKEDEKTIVDLNGDNQIDITDVECCINYIVFGEFEVIKKDVASPSIEVTGEKDSINDYYTSDVEVKVIENEPKENIEKTTISVEMNFSDTGETKVVDTNEKTFKLSRNGTYTITSQTYNKDGNKSDIVTKTIRINKEQKTEVAYKVEHYKEKLDGSYELAETDGLTGTTGLKVTAQAKEYIGFTEDKRKEAGKQFIDVGIAEEHAATLAAGLAISGKKPFLSIYSSFLQRCYDQINHDICRMDLNVVIGIDRAGLVGADGDTHHGVFDIGILRSLPNIIIAQPKDSIEAQDLLYTAFKQPHPFAIRIPRGTIDYNSNNDELIEIGTWTKHGCLDDFKVVCLTYGPDVDKIAHKVMINDLKVLFINCRFIKPLDHKLIDELCQYHKPVVVYETDMLSCGLASSILEYLCDTDQHLEIHRMGIKDNYVTFGSNNQLRKMEHIDIISLFELLNDLLQRE